MAAPKFSIIIPVYNRPDEILELLESIRAMMYRNFEIIVVEDGSTIRCDELIKTRFPDLSITYYYKPNEGPGPSRNFGFAHAKGEYFVVFDSDCIIPPQYFLEVEKSIATNHWDAWGGPDKAHENFTLVQQAMGYTMSSVLTTGGIRGNKRRVGWFQPRSFNMGISRQVFERTKGFAFTRFAEDIELSIRMKKLSFKVGLIPEAYVYHKRRSTFSQFFHQVWNFGKGRILVGSIHPEEVKITHWFPSVFTLGIIAMLLLPLISKTVFYIGLGGFAFYLVAIFLHALFSTRNLSVAVLSIPSALLQLTGYGSGFLIEKIKTHIR